MAPSPAMQGGALLLLKAKIIVALPTRRRLQGMPYGDPSFQRKIQENLDPTPRPEGPSERTISCSCEATVRTDHPQISLSGNTKMASIDINPTRLGQIENAGDSDALFQTLFSGEVLEVFNTATVYQDKHMIRDVSGQKAASFPAVGRTKASYHQPGTPLTGKPIKQNERLITLDGKLVTDVWIDDLDEIKNHYDVRAPFSKQMGEALAKTFDRNVARVAVLAARAAATITGEAGGSVITNVDAKTSGSAIKDVLFATAQLMDEKDLPSGERYAFMKPVTFYAAAATTDLINKDWGGAGNIAMGTFESLAGITIVKTNNVPMEDLTSTGLNGFDVDGTEVDAKYVADFSKTAFHIMQPGALGTVRAMGISTQSEYQITYQATHLVARYAMGHGILRPEQAIEVVIG